MREYLPWIFGVLSALLNGAGYYVYSLQTKRDKSKPKFVTLFIWMAAATINAFTFVEVSSVSGALQYIVGSFAATITFFLALRWGKFAWPTGKEFVVLALCLASLGVYVFLEDSATANLVILLTAVISLQPVLKVAYEKPFEEHSRAWWLWTAAFALTLMNSVFTYDGSFVKIFNPALMLWFHFLVALLAYKGRGPIDATIRVAQILSERFKPHKDKLGTATLLLSLGVGVFGFPHQIWKNYSEGQCGLSIVAIGFAFLMYFARVPYLMSTRSWFMLPVEFLSWMAVAILIGQWLYYL